jgi:hypothetical protein
LSGGFFLFLIVFIFLPEKLLLPSPPHPSPSTAQHIVESIFYL